MLRNFQGTGPHSAVMLAIQVGIFGQRESIRRRVRTVIKHARESLGERICAGQGNGKAGYWLARDADEWAAYQASRKAKAVFQFADLAKQKRAITDRMNGQGRLFDTSTAKATF